MVSSSPERQKTSQVHFTDRYEGACPASMNSFGGTGEPSQPACAGAIANLALSQPFPDSTNIFPHQSSVYRSPYPELREEINIIVELLGIPCSHEVFPNAVFQ